MRLAETVTFGGGGLDRRADLRNDSIPLSQDESAVRIAFWRGKPLLNADFSLAELHANAAILDYATQSPIFLGQKQSKHYFAYDVSNWEPDQSGQETLGAFVDTSRQKIDEPGLCAEFCEIRTVLSELPPLDAELAATAKAIIGWHSSHRFCSRCGVQSQSSDGGWRRDCPDCGGQHFPRTDPVVIMLIEHNNTVLLGRSPGWPDGMYSLLAGFVEPGETMEAAVRREVFEEAGITVGAIEYLASQPWPYPSSLMLGCRGTALDTDIVLDPVEIEDAVWVTREEMLDVFAGQHEQIRPPRQGAIAGFLLEHWLRDQLG